MNDLEQVLTKYFRDERVLYYIAPDYIADNQFVRWNYCAGERKRIIITVGSDEGGEVPVKVFTEAESLDNFLKALIY